MEEYFMKKVIFSLMVLLSLFVPVIRANSGRMSPKEQFEMVGIIENLIGQRLFNEARTQLDVLQNLANLMVRSESLEELNERLEFAEKAAEEELARAEDERARAELDRKLMQKFAQLERVVLEVRDERDFEAERIILEELWRIGQALGVEPATLPAHMARLFQMYEFSIGGDPNSDRAITLMNYLQGKRAPYNEAVELMYYGDEQGRRHGDPWPVLFERGKQLLNINPEEARVLFGLVSQVAGERLRERALFLLAGEQDPEDIRVPSPRLPSPIEVVTSLDERISNFIAMAEGDISEAYSFAVQFADQEAADQLELMVKS